MEVFINEEKINFSLENEKYLSDVMLHLKKWISKNNFFIHSVIIDGKEENLELIFQSSKPIDHIEKIEISIKNRLEQVEEVIPALMDYVDRFIDEIEKGKDSFIINKNEKIEGIGWIIEMVTLIVKTLGIHPRHIFFQGKNLEELLSFFHISMNTLKEYIRDSDFFYSYFEEGFIEKLEDLKKIIEVIISFYNYISGSKDKSFMDYMLDELEEIEEMITEIPEALQDGRDQDAIAMIQKIMAFLESLIMVISKTDISKNIHRKIESIKKEILEYLNETYESFKSGDIVTVGDIVEYEISDKLIELKDLLTFKN